MFSAIFRFVLLLCLSDVHELCKMKSMMTKQASEEFDNVGEDLRKRMRWHLGRRRRHAGHGRLHGVRIGAVCGHLRVHSHGDVANRLVHAVIANRVYYLFIYFSVTNKSMKHRTKSKYIYKYLYSCPRRRANRN